MERIPIVKDGKKMWIDPVTGQIYEKAEVNDNSSNLSTKEWIKTGDMWTNIKTGEQRRDIVNTENSIDSPSAKAVPSIIKYPPAGRGDLLSSYEIPEGTTAETIIDLAIKGKKYISWATMHGLMFGGSFKSFNISKMINQANASTNYPGADALLVDSECRFSSSAPVARHCSFLKRHGYNKMPNIK